MDEQHVQVTCGFCDGKGLILLGKGSEQQCTSCLGKGTVLIKSPAKKCSKCYGKGKIGWSRKCTVCNATGWISSL